MLVGSYLWPSPQACFCKSSPALTLPLSPCSQTHSSLLPPPTLPQAHSTPAMLASLLAPKHHPPPPLPQDIGSAVLSASYGLVQDILTALSLRELVRICSTATLSERHSWTKQHSLFLSVFLLPFYFPSHRLPSLTHHPFPYCPAVPTKAPGHGLHFVHCCALDSEPVLGTEQAPGQ